jgi:predicted lactoylglutathione lyase
MTYSSLLISLPVADRRRAYAFYQEALGLQAIGALADDGVPEPLLFILNLVPTNGFGWVIGDYQDAPAGTDECVIAIEAATDAEVNEIVDRSRLAGANVATEPAPQPRGYAAAFTDPDGHVWTVTSAPLPT